LNGPAIEGPNENPTKRLRSASRRAAGRGPLGALKREPIDVGEVNRALRQAVSRIVMNPKRGTVTIYWHHAEDPSEPIMFGGRHMKWEQMSSSNEAPTEH
jgi:hypothetical protein